MYSKEEKILEYSKQLIASPENRNILEEYKKLSDAYSILLNDFKLIAKISDRLHNKLNVVNDVLVDKTEKLQKNHAIENESLKQKKISLEEKVILRTKALKNAYNNLLIANKELDSFIYRSSHDLKAIIVTILGLCNLVEIETNSKKASNYLELLKSTAWQLDKILKKLLTINDLKNSAPSHEDISLLEIKETLLEEIKSFGHVEHINTVLDLPNSYVYTDKNTLHSLFSGLIAYACNKSNAMGGNKLYVELTAKIEGKDLKASLKFNGSVIESNISKIEAFNLFDMLSRSSERASIELYIVYLSAQKLKGNIKLISSNRRQTIFKVNIPSIIPEE